VKARRHQYKQSPPQRASAAAGQEYHIRGRRATLSSSAYLGRIALLALRGTPLPVPAPSHYRASWSSDPRRRQTRGSMRPPRDHAGTGRSTEFDHPSVPRRRVGCWLVDLVASPAAPRQTVHAVLPHTAFRHRSPSGMRSLVADCAGQAVHAKAAEPPAVIAAGPVAASAAVLVAGEDGQAFVDVPVDGRELGRRVAHRKWAPSRVARG
jgi:hypothetical protein